MAWLSKYIVLRPVVEASTLKEVYRTDEIQKANYWIKYIAQENDAVFMTALHPKNMDQDVLKYSSHKVSSGNVERNESLWRDAFAEFSAPSGQEAEL